MLNSEYNKIPHKIMLNRVFRAYTGGKLLDEWQGIFPAQDGHMSEEFLFSTVEVKIDSAKKNEGLSKIGLPDGSEVTLAELISCDYEGFLGKDYAVYKDICVSARVGDTNVRHVIQCHPTRSFARKYLNYPNGKAEAWYIISTRTEDAYLYAGFKPGITKDLWGTLIKEQDIEGMLNCMHKIPVQAGKVYFVDAGMPHCMGPGILFAEIHESCDYTFRAEKQYLDCKVFSDTEMHYGLGIGGLIDAFVYKTYTYKEILDRCVLPSETLIDTKDVTANTVVSFKRSKRFKVEQYFIRGGATLPAFDGHRIALTIKGSTAFSCGDYTLEVEQGRAVFIPAGAKKVRVEPNGPESEVLICYPYDGSVYPDELFRNPIQVGVLVKDLDEYMKKLNEVFSIGPFRIAQYPPADDIPFREYHGKEGNFTAKFCFFNLGNIELELIQPISGENIWDDFISNHGQGLHHLKFLVEDANSVEKYLNKNGYYIYQQGAAVGPNKGRVWQFYPTYEDIGFDVEIMNE